MVTISPTANDRLTVARVRALQILVAAMAAGVLSLGVVAVVLSANRQDRSPPATGVPILSYVALGYTPVAVVSRLLIVNLIVASGRRRLARTKRSSPPSSEAADVAARLPGLLTDDAIALLGLFMVKTIIGCALLEAGALLGAIAYLLEHTMLAAIATLALWFGLLAHFPTVSGATDWLEEQRRVLENERSQFVR